MKEKLVRALPVITATFLLLAACFFFATWIMLYFKNCRDVTTIIVSTFVVVVFTSSAAFEFFREIQKWMKLKRRDS